MEGRCSEAYLLVLQQNVCDSCTSCVHIMYVAHWEIGSVTMLMMVQVFPCDANELLPIYNKTSLLKYKTARQVGDWSDPQYDPSSRDGGSASLGSQH